MDDRGNITDNEETSRDASNAQVKLPVDRRFEKKGHLYSTRTSEAFEAFDKVGGSVVLLWVLRHQLEPESDSAVRFTKRLEQLNGLHSAIPPFRTFGVDERGYAHVAMEFVRGRLPFLVSEEIKLRQKIFLDVVGVVARIHEKGIILGDIAEQSFLVDDRPTLRLIGALGTFEMEARQTAMLPPQHCLHYLSPEQKSGGGAEPASDIYALGVYGYRLFTGRYLSGDRPPTADDTDPASKAPAPSIIRPDAPRWIDDIIGKCLEVSVNNRFGDARELKLALDAAITGGKVSGAEGRWSRKTLIVTAKDRSALRDEALSSELVKQVERRHRETEEHTRETDPGVGRKFAFVAAGLIISVVIAGLLLKLSGEGENKGTDLVRELDYYSEIAPDFREAIEDIKSESAPYEQRRAALEKIATNDSPIAFELLEATAKNAPGKELKVAAQQFIVERMKRQGFPRTAGVVARWVDFSSQSNIDAWGLPVFRQVVQAGNTAKPLENRRFALEKIYESNQELGLQMAAALALDDTAPDHFDVTLRDLLMRKSGEADLSDKSVYLLILFDPTLALYFDHEIVGLVEEFSTSDLASALMYLGKNDNPLLFDIARETIKRDIVPPFQAVFLKLISDADQFGLKSSVKMALVRGARGEPLRSDIHALGRWYDQGAERALLAICAIAKEQDVALEAFDTLAARSLTTQPADMLVEWIKTSYWKHRAKVVKAVGILGLIDVASPEQVEYAFDQLVPFAGGGSLLKLLINTGNHSLIVLALERIGPALPSDELLELLTHRNKKVRMSTIRALEGRNDLQVLQAIHRAYEKETDEEVREVYREAHWVTQDRTR